MIFVTRQTFCEDDLRMNVVFDFGSEWEWRWLYWWNGRGMIKKMILWSIDEKLLVHDVFERASEREKKCCECWAEKKTMQKTSLGLAWKLWIDEWMNWWLWAWRLCGLHWIGGRSKWEMKVHWKKMMSIAIWRANSIAFKL